MKTRSFLSKDKILAVAVGVLASLMFGLAVVGAFRSYSPVPFWDMWNGYLEFFVKVTEGDWSAWWAQHNEHRIVLARLLFWADLRWFGGASWFLIAVNYVLVGLGALVFWLILRDAVAAEKSTANKAVLGLFITAWLFLWMQHENLTWAFQSQFILAQLLPLCALYWLHKSVANIHSRYFLVACSFGLASVGTMANGILSLPLMCCYALLTRQSAVRVGVLAALSVVTLYYYFHDYQTVAHHGSLTLALKENPYGLIQYVLLYLGSPFYWLLGQGAFGKTIAFLAGLFLVISSAWFAIKIIRQPSQATLQLALLFFILYIGGTALGTAGGRLIFGVDQALGSRYTTPTLMAWAALLVLYAPALLAAGGVKRKILLFPFAVLALLMIPLQLKALQSQDEGLFERRIAALALELRIKDQRQIGSIYPSAAAALSFAEKPSADNLSIFGMYPFRDARGQLGTTIRQLALPACQGALDEVEAVDGDTRFVRVRGWMFNPASKSVPQLVRLLDDQGKVVGHALSGATRSDVAEAIDKKAIQAGYRGYLLSDQMGKVLILHGENLADSSCRMQASVPVLAFSLTTAKPSAKSVTVNSANVLAGNQWSGSDYAKSAVEGIQVYGSFISADADVGTISLRIKLGDRIFYRSGPTGGRQLLEISGTGLPAMKLPVSTDWVLLNFSGQNLPNGEFTIRFSDDGSGWGEWSAIGVKTN